MEKAEEMVAQKLEGYERLQAALERAQGLESVATYGVKMAEKARELLRRLALARAAAEALRSSLEPAARDLEALAAASEAAREGQARAEREALEQAALEAERRPLEELLVENERKMEAQRVREEAVRRREEEEQREEREREAQRASAEDALLRMEQEADGKIARLGAKGACGEALSSMLAASVGAYRGVVEGLEAMITAVASEPADLRLRLIRIRNEEFQERLGRQPGVWLFLRAVGFEAMSREQLPSDVVKALNLSSSPPTERFLFLSEPDMMKAYEEWSQWHQRLRAIASFLQELGKLAFHRIAHLGRHGQDVVSGEVLSAKELLAAWESAVP